MFISVFLCNFVHNLIKGMVNKIEKLYNSLNNEETYDCSKLNIWSYNKVTDIIDNIQMKLSNMAGGYSFIFNNVKYNSNEVLYLMGEFSNNISIHYQIQNEMLSAKSGFAAKRFIKSKYKEYIRDDFDSFRNDWMLFVVWQKCIGNDDFKKKLLEIPDNAILIEDTTSSKSLTRNIWGCSNKDLKNKRNELEKEIILNNNHLKNKELEYIINIETNKIRNIGVFVGQNNMGKILMICRECIKIIRYHHIIKIY